MTIVNGIQSSLGHLLGRTQMDYYIWATIEGTSFLEFHSLDYLTFLKKTMVPLGFRTVQQVRLFINYGNYLQTAYFNDHLMEM